MTDSDRRDITVARDQNRQLARRDGLAARGLYDLACLSQSSPQAVATAAFTGLDPDQEDWIALNAGRNALQAEKWDQAITLLSQIPEKHQDSPYLPEAYCELGRAKQNSGKEAEAMQDYEKAASLSLGEVGALARFMTGELTFGQKKFAEAIRQFQRVMYGYGGESAPPEVKKWQAKAGFEAARCAEVQIKHAQGPARAELLKQAQQAYQYVIEKHPQDELAAQAKTRLQELSKL